MRNIFTGPLLKVIGIAGVILVCTLIVWSFWGMPAPREQDRMGPVSGEFSIIRPRDWQGMVKYGRPDGSHFSVIESHDPKGIGRPQTLTVGRLRNPPDEAMLHQSRMQLSQFQSQPAWIFQGWIKKDFYWQAMFQRHGDWYEISLQLNHGEDIPASGWWAYLTSFQAKPAPASMPATMEAITPLL